jgi:WD40 repeat protein
VRECKDEMWLRPLTASLTPPGGPLIRTFKGHTGTINDVSVTPDGRCAISASYDNTLKVWDMETGMEIRTLEGHTGGQCSLCDCGRQARNFGII